MVAGVPVAVISGEGNGSPLQRSCLENPRDGGACSAAVHGVVESDTTDATQQQQQLPEGESLKVFLTSEQT